MTAVVRVLCQVTRARKGNPQSELLVTGRGREENIVEYSAGSFRGDLQSHTDSNGHMTITLQGGFGMPYAQGDKEHMLILDREDRPPSTSALVNNNSTGVTNRNMGHLRAVISQKSSLITLGQLEPSQTWGSRPQLPL